MEDTRNRKKLLVYMVHPDLGIGGAEMLVVNAAAALVKAGHDVRIYTAHHDKDRCFSETKPGGILGEKVVVCGSWIPRTIAGRFHVVCAVARMVWIAVYLSVVALFGAQKPDVFFCDQVSHMVPFLRIGTGKKVVFYCHFPDKLLCVDRGSLLKRLYRAPVDWWEESSTGSSDIIVVNSKFTGSIFREAFKSLSSSTLRVLYPSIDMSQFDRTIEEKERTNATNGFPDGLRQHLKKYGSDTVLLVSINRFERKKNLQLAIESLGNLVQDESIDPSLLARTHLIMAGGYDPRLAENVEYLEELKSLTNKFGLEDKVSFLKSFTDDQRLILIQMARCVIYTPDREHFGIVPLEAMYAGAPVVAVSSGGPLETVQDGETGYLRPQDSTSFSEAVAKLVKDKDLAARMGKTGRERVSKKFSLKAFGDELENILFECIDMNSRVGVLSRISFWLFVGSPIIVLIVSSLMLKS